MIFRIILCIYLMFYQPRVEGGQGLLVAFQFEARTNLASEDSVEVDYHRLYLAKFARLGEIIAALEHDIKSLNDAVNLVQGFTEIRSEPPYSDFEDLLEDAPEFAYGQMSPHAPSMYRLSA